MMKCKVTDPSKALAYITDCNLATIEHMAILKSRRAGEFRRQIAIAQTACDWMYKFGIDPSGTRAEDIVGKITVEKWAAQRLPE